MGLFLIALNHSMTDCEFLHWFTLMMDLILLLMLSNIILLAIPSSLLAGLSSRHFGLLAKFSLWSFRVGL